MGQFGAIFCRVALIFQNDLCSMPDNGNIRSFLFNLEMLWGPPSLPEIWYVLIHAQFVNLHIYPVRVTKYLWFTCTFSECGISWNTQTGDVFCRSTASWSSDRCTIHIFVLERNLPFSFSSFPDKDWPQRISHFHFPHTYMFVSLTVVVSSVSVKVSRKLCSSSSMLSYCLQLILRSSVIEF